MIRPTVALSLLAAVTLGGAAVAPANAAADARGRVAGTQCKPGERVAYSCAMGKKVISVCVAAGRQVTYRYGPLGKPEMVIASTGGDGKAHRKDVMLAEGGSQTHLRFTNAGYDYIVFSGDTGPHFDPPNVRSSGFAVLKGEDEVSSRQCGRNGALQTISYDDIQFIDEEPDETFDTER